MKPLTFMTLRTGPTHFGVPGFRGGLAVGSQQRRVEKYRVGSCGRGPGWRTFAPWLASGSMTAGVSVRFYVSPHQHNHLMGMLEPRRVGTTPLGLVLLQRLALVCKHPVLGVRSEARPGQLCTHVDLVVDAPAGWQPSNYQYRLMQHRLRTVFAQELLLHVTQQRTLLGMELKSSIQMLLSSYSIGEEELSLDAAKMIYHRARRRYFRHDAVPAPSHR